MFAYLLFALLAACVRPASPPSFVVVLVDTLRLDRLAFADPAAPPTPHFDRLRAESVWFANARANSSWTLPSVASLLLSQRPAEHGVSGWGSRLASDQLSLPDVLRGAGYRSAMFTANRIIAGERGFVGRFDAGRLVEDPGFAGALDTAEAFASADDLHAAGLEWLDAVRAAGSPYLLLLHTMDPHAPYPCPNPSVPGCARTARALNARLLQFDWDFDAEERARIARHYDAGVVATDRALGRLIEALDERGVLDDAWLVLLSDHGELLGEEGLYLHGRSLASPLTRVPLLFRAPGGGAARRVDAPVSLMDVSPTLLALAGRPAPAAFRGVSFAAALEGEPVAPRPVVLELPQVRPVPDARRRHVFGLVDGERSLLVSPTGEVEAEGGSALAPSEARSALDAGLEALGLAFDPADYGARDRTEPSAEMLEALRRLGYIE